MDELIQAIAAAFPSAPIEGSELFAKTIEPGGGMWGGYLDSEELEAGVLGRSWDALEPRFLERHHDALAYLGPDAYAALLPAYLAAFVRTPEALDMLPTFLLRSLRRGQDPDEREVFEARVARLTEAQRGAVAHVLEGLTQRERHAPYLDRIEQTLDSHWRGEPR